MCIRDRPNDIIMSGKKVCGILTEMSAQFDYVNHIVVGIGINVQNKSFPKDIDVYKRQMQICMRSTKM